MIHGRGALVPLAVLWRSLQPLSLTNCCFPYGALLSLAVQKLKLTDWMLVMCKLSEIQMSSKLVAVADDVEPLKTQLQKLGDENKQLHETIDQQKSVIAGLNALLKESAKQ